jgi:predicted DNA-binding transcriptional regulator AlpA
VVSAAENTAPEALWTVQDVVSFLRVSRSWVYGKALSGELPSLRIGGLLRFDPGAIRAWALGPSARVLRLPPGR